VAAFSPLLDVLADVPDPRRAQGQLYKLPHVLLFAILAIVTGCNSYRGIVTFIDVHRRKLNAAFGLNWRRAPAHTAVRYILQGLDPTGVETAFRRHAALLQAARATPGQGRAGQHRSRWQDVNRPFNRGWVSTAFCCAFLPGR